MKRSEYLALNTGEKTELVATDVMGREKMYDPLTDRYFWGDPSESMDLQSFDYYVDEFFPIEDWNAMRRVIERIWDSPMNWVNMCDNLSEYLGSEAIPVFLIRLNPEAVCIAALMAKGVIEDD